MERRRVTGTAPLDGVGIHLRFACINVDYFYTGPLAEKRPGYASEERARANQSLPRHFEKERVNRNRHRSHVIDVEQRVSGKVGIALIDDAIREVGHIRAVVG
jgi:hypothetical protein